jgi:O-antigen/teichoic acid export membrane protein
LNRAKLFVDNFLSYGLINTINKIIPFIFLPIITRMLPNTSDYGIFDLFYLITYFGISLAYLGLYNSIFREFFERDEHIYKYDVMTTAFRIVFFNSILISLILLIFNKYFTNLFFGIQANKYIIMFASLSIFTSVNADLFRLPSRVENNKKVFFISNFLNAFLQKAIAIILIILGFTYYSLIWGLIISSFIVMCYLWFKNKIYFLSGKFDKKIAKELLKIGLPFLPVSLILWVYQSVDRIMIAKYIDLNELGIYSIGAKIAQISQFLYFAFSSMWIYFGYTTMKDKDQKEFIGKIFNIIFIACTAFYVIFFLMKTMIFKSLFTGDYVRGEIVFPYLLLCPLLHIFASVFELQILIIKKTYIFLFVYSIGCVSNIILNYLFIHKFGVVGVSIATVISYATMPLIYLIFVVHIKKLVVLKLKIYIMLFLFAITFIIINYYGLCRITYYTISLYLIIITTSYYREFINIYHSLIK